MKQFLLHCAAAVSLVLLVVCMGGCGSGSVRNSGVHPTPTPTPTPESTTSLGFAFLRSDGTIKNNVVNITSQQLHGARRAAKLRHAIDRQAPLSVDSVPVDIYVWPFTDSRDGWWFGSARKITASPAAYTSTHLSLNGSSIVFSVVVDGYNQVFTTNAPADGNNLGEILQLTTDTEHHWLPHLSADGSKVVFTKSDPNSNGDEVCVINNTVGATENCFDFSSTSPTLKGAYMWHASWSPQGKIAFEAWDGPLHSDEIFMVSGDGTGLAQITNNAGTKNYDECPSISSDGNWMAVDTWNDRTQYFDIAVIDLNSNQRQPITSGEYTQADAWDPLETPYSTVWVSKLSTDQSLELYILTFDFTRMTNNTYDDYFERSPE
jgi:WD40 repeat protein